MRLSHKILASVVLTVTVVGGLVFATQSGASLNIPQPVHKAVLRSVSTAPASQDCLPGLTTPPAITLDPALSASGDEIKVVQIALGITADGVYGPLTAAALPDFVGMAVCPPDWHESDPYIITALQALQDATPRLTASATARIAAQTAPRAPVAVVTVQVASVSTGPGPCSAPNLPLSWIAWCESGCNPTKLNTQGSSAAGKYQWLTSSWGGYGGYATADQAPESVQDQKSLEAYQASGMGPWEASRGCWGGQF